MNKLSRAIAEKRFLLGTVVTSPSPALAEALSNTSIDWLCFDMEHSTLDIATVQSMIQAMNPKCMSFIRIEEPSAVFVKRALDTGCDGVIIPQVNSAEIAAAMVTAGKFPPAGGRSIGLGRALGYGNGLVEKLRTANEDSALIVQIEHRDAVAQAAAIASCPGIDAVFVGPYDLSGSLGKPANVADEQVQTAIDQVIAVARQKGKPAGIFVGSEDAARKEIARGFTFIAVGADVLRLTSSVQATVSAIRGGS